jgi:hypothetical protein
MVVALAGEGGSSEAGLDGTDACRAGGGEVGAAGTGTSLEGRTAPPAGWGFPAVPLPVGPVLLGRKGLSGLLKLGMPPAPERVRARAEATQTTVRTPTTAPAPSTRPARTLTVRAT